jgi:hypothetical protein
MVVVVIQCMERQVGAVIVADEARGGDADEFRDVWK